MSQILKTAKLAVGYGSHVVVKDVSFTLDQGHILTLIGPNGSGKSTILKSITQQLRVLGGAVYLDGSSMKNLREYEIAKKMSMVMTERIHPELMSCRDVVSTGRYPYTGTFGILTKEDWNKVDRTMELLHADEVADQDFLKISDGQRQRVMLARAICQEPQILILDEPTSYLDMRYKLEILENIRKLARESEIAVVMSLHELDLVPKISDYVACVDGDNIGKYGTPEDVFQGDYIQRLYGVSEKSYDPILGMMYLPVNNQKPEYFVICGGGSGIPIFQKLQRNNIPFAAGILSKNDTDYAVASAIAAEVVCTESYYPMEEKHFHQAKQLIDQCEKCICTLKQFGPLNEENRQLLQYAMERGRYVEHIK